MATKNPCAAKTNGDATVNKASITSVVAQKVEAPMSEKRKLILNRYRSDNKFHRLCTDDKNADDLHHPTLQTTFRITAMTTIVSLPPLPAGATLKDHEDSMLKITRGDRSKGEPKFMYRFSQNEYVVTSVNNTKPIPLVLDDHTHLNVAEIYIHSVCCSRGNSIIIEKIKDNSGNTVPFGKTAVRVELLPKLMDQELIQIGLIVAIKEKDEVELILCDPQVGNGPPPYNFKSNPAIPLN